MSRYIPLMCLSLFTLVFLAGAPVWAKNLDIKDVKSPQGLTAWLVEDHSVPVISLSFAFKNAGSKNETEATQGLARILSNTMDEGAGELDSQAFQKALLDNSVSLAFTVDRDDFGGRLKTLTRHKDKAFALLKLALTKPRFDQEAVDRMVAANQSRIRSSLADPDWIAARLMNDIAYKGYPYALNSGGTLSTLASIKPDDLRGYLKAQLSRDRLMIGVSGDITAAELGLLLDDLFGALPAKAASPQTFETVKLGGAGTMSLYKKDIPQTIIDIIAPGIDRHDPAYFQAEILNFVLGGSGFGSRLTEEIREKRGLTYGIYTGLANMDQVSTLSLGTSTKNASVKEMLDLITAEWAKMEQDGITGQELADAKSYLIGSVPLSLTSTDKISGFLLSLQTEGYEPDFLDKREAALKAATVPDIKTLAGRLLDPAQFTTILVGNPEGVTPTQTVTDIPNAE
ncbi:MAG: insulinase family protein [Alphaproteobacteria bacterium]|nr:insulinase family protein [Alphaproteobacteria bacterium]